MNARIRSVSALALATVAAGTFALAAPASALEPAAATAVTATVNSTATATATATGTGTVSAHLTVGKVHLDGSRTSNVTCTLKGSTYTVTTSRVTVNGHQVTGHVIIRNYTGPGTYSASVSLTVKGDKVTVAGVVKGAQVTVDATGGTWSFDTVGTGTVHPKLQGTTISGSLSYGCNA
jgi:hypothetical protein